MVDTEFYEYVSTMLREAGHMITSNPVYTNHTALETLYIDSSKDITVNRFDRLLLMQIRNVSRLVEISWPGVVDDLTEVVHIYSITIDAPKRNRSQIVADTHRLLHQYWDCHHSIVFCKNRHQYIISFANKDQSHILSDWFDINVDNDEVIERIDTANISLESSIDYFSDFIYAVARKYYLYPISVEEATYGMIPPTFVASSFGVKTDVTKDDIKALAKANMLLFETQYGDDYVAPVLVGYDEQAQFRRMATELDRISFELELAAEMDNDEIVDAFDDDDDLDEFADDFDDDWDDELDPAIFDDPVLMVKWLEKQQNRPAGSPEELITQTKKIGSELVDTDKLNVDRRETERRVKEREDAEQRERERLITERCEHDRLEAERLRAEQRHLEAKRKRQDAEQKRQDAEQKHSEATLKRSEAERLTREVQQAEAIKAQKRTDYDRAEQLRLEAETTYSEYCQHELLQKRSEADEKRRRARELRGTALLKRKEAGRLTEELHAAEIRSSEKHLIVESCMQLCMEAVHMAQQEALQREQERIEAEQRERERLEKAARRQAQLDTAKRELNIHNSDPFAIWLSAKANDEFLVDIYFAFVIVQRYAYKTGLINAPLLTILDIVVIRTIQESIRVKKDFMKLDANARYFCGLAMRYYAQYASELEAARIEQERLAEERREKKRIAELQQRLTELESEYTAAVARIQNRYKAEQSQIRTELARIEKRLGEIEARVSSLSFMQFFEKKGLKAEQADLLDKRSRLEYQSKELENRFRKQLSEEKQRFENEKLTLSLC